MEQKKFLASQAMVYATRSWLDNMRIFFVANLIFIGSCVATMIAAVVANLLFAKRVFEIIKKLRVAQTMDIPADMADHVKTLLLLMGEYKYVLMLTGLLVWFVLTGLSLGFAALLLEYYDKDTVRVTQLFSWFLCAPACMFATLLFALMTFVGSCLLIIPGFYIGIRCILFPYVMIDRCVGPVAALKESWRITQHHGWMIFGLVIAHAFLMSVSILMGWLLWPVIGLSYVYAYRA
ncbi:MAG TPA: hypothetical protein VLG71_03370, partial [Candidatus Limnocylindria bacterium]|nr:hypothetical protein [Candidatus Limnocylindria bacterium]